MPAENATLDQFEKKLAELEELVRALESGDAPLEKAVQHFERGMALSQSCESLLKQAELKIQQLTQASDGSAELSDMDSRDSDA